MIQNLFVIKDSIPIITHNYGDCHTLGTDGDLISSFLTAIQSFSTELTGNTIDQISLEKVRLYFQKSERMGQILFIIISDIKDNPKLIINKINRITEFFFKNCKQELQAFKGNTKMFSDFGNLLVEEHIVDGMCLKYENCAECPKRLEDSKAIGYFKRNRKSFFSKLKGIFNPS